MAAITSAQELLASYARNAVVSNPLRVGIYVLMTPLFDDNGNVNRAGKQIRVTVEEPVGKYELFSREEHGKKKLYYLTASGRIDGTSTYILDQYDPEKHDYVNARPTEEQLDEALTMAFQIFERDMANPRAWVKYQHAAALNRIDDCDAHNAPVRVLRDMESQQRKEEVAREIEENERRAQAKYNARVDKIAKAIENGETIRVAYEGGKSPVLDLFKLYDVKLPLRTQGWVKTGLAELSDGGYRYFKSKHKRDSTSFMGCYDSLRRAIRQTPIEEKRASLAPATPATDKEDFAVEHKLYERFTELFPRFMSGELVSLRLEAPYAKPLELERLYDGRISIAHTYEQNGDTLYEPRIVLLPDSGEKKLTARSFELSEPPRNDVVCDANSNVDTAMQKNIHVFLSAWLDRAEKQRFLPVAATIDVDGDDIAITFDTERSASLPSGDAPMTKQYTLGYGRSDNGITVLNMAEKRGDDDHVAVALVSRDRSVTFYDRDMPHDVMKKIVAMAIADDTWHYDFNPAPKATPVYETETRATPETAQPEVAVLDMSRPDPLASAADMTEYGYLQEDMHPLSPAKALELFDAGHTIYLLNPDNTEDVAFDRDEIITFSGNGLCGITYTDWKASPEYAARAAETSLQEPDHGSMSPAQTFSRVGKGPQTLEAKPSLLGKLEQNKQRVERTGANDAAKPKEREG